MLFKRFPSIDNHYQSKSINLWIIRYSQLRFDKYVLQEKIHGSNFQIALNATRTKFGKRSNWLKASENFYDWTNVIDNYKHEIKTLRHWLVKHSDAKQMRMYGELYGYGIQNGVDYCTDKRVIFYDMYLDDIPMCPKFMEDVLYLIGLTHLLIPVIAYVDSLQEAFDYDISKTKTLLNDGVANKFKNQVIEGVVIKPYEKVYTNVYDHPFYLKMKNPWAWDRSKPKNGKRARNLCSPELQKAQELFMEYLNETRVKDMFSKEGPIEKPSQIGKYISLVLEDAKADFLKDHEKEFMKCTSKEQKLVFSITGRIIAPILKTFL